MALTAKLAINGMSVGHLYVKRLEPPGRPDFDDICRYEWQINYYDLAGGRHHWSNAPNAPLEHRYGDWPWALVAKVIEAAAPATPDAIRR